jgi:hypothetical protein
MYNPTTSRSLASSSGSVENLNVSSRHGWIPQCRQIGVGGELERLLPPRLDPPVPPDSGDLRVQRLPHDGKLRADRDRIAGRRGRAIGKVAAARKLLTLVFYGLRDGHIRCLTPAAAATA